MKVIIKIIKQLKDSGVSIDGVTKTIKHESITHNIFRIQYIICRYHCITFIEYMLAGKTLLDYTSLFFPNDCKKNDKIIYYY